MNNKRIAELFTLVLMVFLLLPISTVVNASTEISLGTAYKDNDAVSGLSGRNSNGVNRAQDRVLQHSTGKIGILAYDTATAFRIKLYSSTGVLLASTLISSTTAYGGVYIKEYDTNNFIIFWGDCTTNFKVHFITYNINTFTLGTDYYSTFNGKGGADALDRLTQPYYYSGSWYIGAFYTSYYNANGGYLIWCKYIVSSHATSTFGDYNYQHYGYISEVMSFQDQNNLNLVYFAMSKNGVVSGDSTTPEYWVLDLSGTPSFTALATSGTSGLLPDASVTYDRPYSNALTDLGGGIYQSGTYYYLYYIWVYPIAPTTSSATTRTYKTVVWIGKFNNTITAGSLISQQVINRTFTDNSGGTYNTVGLCYGFIDFTHGLFPSVRLDIVVSRPLGGKYLMGVICDIVDLKAMKNDFDMVSFIAGVDNLAFTYKASTAIVQKNTAYTFSYQEIANTDSYLYLGERALQVIVTETIAYSPIDNPLLTLKPYVFTWTIYKNGIADMDGDTYKIYFDNFQSKTGTVTSSGKASASITSSLTGDHTVSIDIYDSTGTMILHGINHSYNWVALGGGNTVPSGNDLMTGYYNLLMIWVPIGLFVIIPSLAFALLGSKFSTVGMIIGLLFGGFIGIVGGVMTNLLPQYVLYLYLLLMGVTITIVARSGQ
jgi:hypothetical protein